VCPLQAEPPLARPLTDGCTFDESSGVVHCTDDLQGAAVYEWIEQRLGEKALLASRVSASLLLCIYISFIVFSCFFSPSQVHKARLEDTDQKSNLVRRQLCLKHLHRDPKLSLGDFHKACDRLLRQTRALAPILEGSSLKIGFATRISSDRLAVEIAWDCPWDFKD